MAGYGGHPGVRLLSAQGVMPGVWRLSAEGSPDFWVGPAAILATRSTEQFSRLAFSTLDARRWSDSYLPVSALSIAGAVNFAINAYPTAFGCTPSPLSSGLMPPRPSSMAECRSK
jgi:hypothetical protein